MTPPVSQPLRPPQTVQRHGHGATLAQALQHSRADSLAVFDCFEAALGSPQLALPYAPELNPPLWELGHLSWFQRWWVGRNSQWRQGWRADPSAFRTAARPAGADALFDSSRVEHSSRWQLPLPGAQAQREESHLALQETLQVLASAKGSDAELYFFRLLLAHEDMHFEAGLYMMQSLALPLNDTLRARFELATSAARAARATGAEPAPLHFDAGEFQLGHDGPGFVFDNESASHVVALPATAIDGQVLRWADYLPFVEQGGYAQTRGWSEPALAWLQTLPPPASDLRVTQTTPPAHKRWPDDRPRCLPRYLRRQDGEWQQQRWGQWLPLDLRAPACHLSCHEAEAWCRWAGRRLPTEAEWERAAMLAPQAFRWGEVWEWTASSFTPYPGFVAHPYRDYSAPWFGSRRVLRGASWVTEERMRHPRYRNFYTPDRNDIFAGFRSCAL